MHELEYVLPSEPHTGLKSALQASEHPVPVVAAGVEPEPDAEVTTIGAPADVVPIWDAGAT